MVDFPAAVLKRFSSSDNYCEVLPSPTSPSRDSTCLLTANAQQPGNARLTYARRVVSRKLSRFPSDGNDTALPGVPKQRVLTRRHSICFEKPPNSELSKMREMCTNSLPDGRQFEFLCSSQFREKYVTYMSGLEKQGIRKAPSFLRTVQTSLQLRRRWSSRRNSAAAKSLPVLRVSAGRDEKLLIQHGLCELCRTKSGRAVPLSIHLPARQQQQQQQKQCACTSMTRKTSGFVCHLSDDAEHGNDQEGQHIGESPTPNATGCKCACSSPPKPAEARAEASDLSVPHRGALGDTLAVLSPAFYFSTVLSSDGVWISSKRQVTHSTQPNQALLAQPGFRSGRYAWTVRVLSSTVPAARYQSFTAAKTRSEKSALAVAPRPFRSGSNADYATPWDAITEPSTKPLKRAKTLHAKPSTQASQGKDRVLSIGLCARTELPSYLDIAANAACSTLEEFATLDVTMVTTEKTSPSAEASASAFRSWLAKSRKRRSDQQVHTSPSATGHQHCRASAVCTAMRWMSGDSATVIADCREGVLTVVNHRSGETGSLAIASMAQLAAGAGGGLGEAIHSPTPASQDSADDYAGNGTSPARPDQQQWLHPYFVLYDTNLVLMMVHNEPTGIV